MISYNPTPWLGFVGDLGGAYGTIDYRVTAPGGSTTIGFRTNLHTFLFGPQFSLRGKSATLFGRALIGAVKLNQSVTIQNENLEGDDTSFAFGFGGGFDVKVTDRISWRAIQADAIFTRFETRIDGQKLAGGTQPNLRLSTGFVFRNKD